MVNQAHNSTPFQFSAGHCPGRPMWAHPTGTEGDGPVVGAPVTPYVISGNLAFPGVGEKLLKDCHDHYVGAANTGTNSLTIPVSPPVSSTVLLLNDDISLAEFNNPFGGVRLPADSDISIPTLSAFGPQTLRFQCARCFIIYPSVELIEQHIGQFHARLPEGQRFALSEDNFSTLVKAVWDGDVQYGYSQPSPPPTPDVLRPCHPVTMPFRFGGSKETAVESDFDDGFSQQLVDELLYSPSSVSGCSSVASDIDSGMDTDDSESFIDEEITRMFEEDVLRAIARCTSQLTTGSYRGLCYKSKKTSSTKRRLVFGKKSPVGMSRKEFDATMRQINQALISKKKAGNRVHQSMVHGMPDELPPLLTVVTPRKFDHRKVSVSNRQVCPSVASDSSDSGLDTVGSESIMGEESNGVFDENGFRGFAGCPSQLNKGGFRGISYKCRKPYSKARMGLGKKKSTAAVSRKEFAATMRAVNKELNQAKKAAQMGHPLVLHDMPDELPPLLTVVGKPRKFTPRRVCEEKLSERHLRKCRGVYGIDHQDQWCNMCRWKKRCNRFSTSENDIELDG